MKNYIIISTIPDNFRLSNLNPTLRYNAKMLIIINRYDKFQIKSNYVQSNMCRNRGRPAMSNGMFIKSTLRETLSTKMSKSLSSDSDEDSEDNLEVLEAVTTAVQKRASLLECLDADLVSVNLITWTTNRRSTYLLLRMLQFLSSLFRK
jgi:hypothetical protein